MHVCSLNAFELQMLVMVAERRNCGKQPNGVTNRKVDKKLSDFSINLHGAMGEYAVGKLLGIKIDTSVALSGDDKVSDLTLNGKTIQVKTVVGTKTTSFLYFRGLDRFKADIGVLAIVHNAVDVEILGWVTREQFLLHHKMWKNKYGEVPSMASNLLNDPSNLKQYIEML